jgi:hypothetical protein
MSDIAARIVFTILAFVEAAAAEAAVVVDDFGSAPNPSVSLRPRSMVSDVNLPLRPGRSFSVLSSDSSATNGSRSGTDDNSWCKRRRALPAFTCVEAFDLERAARRSGGRMEAIMAECDLSGYSRCSPEQLRAFSQDRTVGFIC